MRSIAMVLSVSVMGVLASTATVLADDSIPTTNDRTVATPVAFSVPMPPQRSYVIDPLTGRTVSLANSSSDWRVRPVTLWLSMGTGF